MNLIQKYEFRSKIRIQFKIVDKHIHYVQIISHEHTNDFELNSYFWNKILIMIVWIWFENTNLVPKYISSFHHWTCPLFFLSGQVTSSSLVIINLFICRVSFQIFEDENTKIQISLQLFRHLLDFILSWDWGF